MEAGALSRLERSAEAVNARLRAQVRGRPARLYDAAYHTIRSGGKRLRPHLAITCCEMLGGTRRGAIHAASALELVHNFSLVHDDIMDNDPVRHGVRTVHKKFGDAAAILAGDVLFSKAYAEILRSPAGDAARARLASTLAGACVEICEGQSMDIEMAAGRGIPGRAEYIEMVGKKTAALFEAACVMGAISAGAGARDIGNVGRFGRNLGIAFQITDDVIGAVGDPRISKKPVGNDLREGKKSLPILLALGRARGADARAIRSCFGNRRAGARALARAVEIMRESGAAEAARRAAAGYATAARRAIGPYDGPAAAELARILASISDRSA